LCFAVSEPLESCPRVAQETILQDACLQPFRGGRDAGRGRMEKRLYEVLGGFLGPIKGEEG